MPKRSQFHRALVAAIVDPGKKHAPPGPVPRKKPRTGATSEPHDAEGQSGRNDRSLVEGGIVPKPRRDAPAGAVQPYDVDKAPPGYRWNPDQWVDPKRSKKTGRRAVPYQPSRGLNRRKV